MSLYSIYIASLDNDMSIVDIYVYFARRKEKKKRFFLLLILDETSELYDELCLYIYYIDNDVDTRRKQMTSVTVESVE